MVATANVKTRYYEWDRGEITPKGNVRFGSKADICTAIGHVRFTPESDTESVLSNVREGAKRAFRSVNFLDVSRLPSFAEEGLCWAIQSKS